MAYGTINVDTLTASTGVLATQNGMTGIAKAWVQFTGSTAVINGSFNISSITRNSTGYYTINFTTAMTNANYSVAGSFSAPYGTRFSGGLTLFTNPSGVVEVAPTVSAFNIVTPDIAGNAVDPKYTCIAVLSS